ncbi:hypothetical protein, partial [uncultured Fibrobacter sp.]|uniref:hypothetical protein n=1 Tax=uncultured Fibrobacter sp. TaxID=261512 RepID=UPI002638B9EF
MILNEKNTTMHVSRMKGGVSLFTVLMFMLVATIAATATYKWLTTESGSSKDRMLQREAYQSAVAGIESARGWMTYNANETGALIKQYKDGGNVPIKLNERLAAFVRAGQSYDVYLVGVSASPDNPTYKLKLASVGYARDKQVKHSEVAILNVNGLYQVRLPVEEAADTIKFEFNYFGGSTQAQGHIGAKSMLVNGDLFGSNPVYTETDLIVTGNVEISGNSVGADGTACVGGSLEAKNGVFGNDFYIEGDARNFGWPSASEAKNGYSGTSGDYNLAGNVYINGNLVQATKNQVFPKNLSLNGTWTTNLQGYNMSVTGNLCLGETGFIFLPTLDKTFKVEGNVWMPGNVGMPNNISFWKGTMSGNNCTCNKYKRTCKVSWGWGCWQYNDYELEDTDVPCTGNSTSGDHNTKYVVQYCSGDLDLNADDDNWAAYERLRLGMSPSSEVYIKNSHSLTDYKAMRDEKKGVTKLNFIQSCSGTNCVTPSYWSDETLYPYLKKDAHPADKPKEYYIYSLPAGINDVEYGPYHDEFWTKDIHAFFVNFPTGPGGKSANTTYTSSYHTQDDGAHPDLEGSNYYRFLNYSGGKIKGSPYCKKMGGKNFTPECGVAPWFSSDGTVSRIFPAEKPFECAESVKDYCLEKLGPHRPGCDGASYKVDDLLKTAYDKFEKYANKGCADVTTWNNDLSSKLNTCYTNNTKTDAIAKENLYNGYQVVKVTHTGKADPTTALNGKFIIIVTNKLGQQSLPPTTEGSYVFLYLPEGGESTVQPAVESGKYNYFIFTDQDVASGSGDAGFMFNNSVLSGSIYAKAENCAKVQNFKARKMEYNEALVTDLQKNGVLCDAKATSCGGANTPTSSSSSDPTIEHGDGGYDSYYIGVAPQLSVTVESQYKNKEATNVEHAQDVNPSFIVLPRIVYLTKDAKGKLSNYYNIVPLNTTKSVTNPSVTCSGIPTTGKLTNVEAGDLLEEGTYTCNAEGSLVSAQSGGTSSARMRVPFWVVVRGEGGSIPVASFAEPIKEVNIGASTVASLVLTNTTSGTPQSCLVKFSVSEHGEEWEVKHVEGNATPVPETPGVYTATVTSEGSLSVLNVTNKSSEDGSIILNVIDAGECNPGSPEVIYNANTARIERRGLEAYCSGDGSGDGQCSPGGEYRKAIERPDCATAEEWVSAKGNSCSVEATNNTWNCAISGNVSLDAASSIEGCETIIVPQSIPAPLTVNETYYLYASLKAKPMTFHAGFETGGEISGNPVIKIEVKDENGTERKSNCSYSNFKDPENTSCDVLVYRNSTVTLTLDPENPKDFNYWKCESGPDCFSDEPFTGNSYLITITGDGNIVYAHFGEQDKHCFFDEFKDARESGGTVKLNRGTVQCEENSTNYCIDYCENDGNKCPTNQVTSSFPNAKWRLVERSTASWEDIDYSSADARIALKSSATRGKKESEKKQAIIMSSVQAGLYGTLKALFQPPHEGVSAGDEAKATVKKSGFILRSNSEVDSYLMLNVFIASDGVLKARLCVNGGSSCSEDVVLKRNGSSYSPERNHLVTLSATIEKKVGESYDVLTVEIYSSAWAEEPYSAEIKLSDGEISGVTNTGDLPNEYVGYALSDQNFKIYGIGWRSETYNASCWDTYPTINCSFKAAYPAGIVPVNTAAKPWVGFSAWF